MHGRARSRASRPALPALAAAVLALAACKVDLEGAPCATPGETADCPSGQACGNDLRCSPRAAECAATRCDVGAASCVAADGKGAGSDFVKRCTLADPACGQWELFPCASRGFECRTDGGSAACECPPAAERVDVDPAAGSSAAASPAPTGADAPASCRFKDLADGLAAASAWVGGGADRFATVRIRGTPTAMAPLVLSVPHPFAIPARVKLAAETVATPEAFVIEAPGGAGPAVSLGDGSGLEGFTVRATGTHPSGVAVECVSTAAGPSTVRSVVVTGTNLTNGVEVKQACGMTLDGVRSRDAAAAALLVDAPGADVDVVGGSFGGSARGVEARAGQVDLRGPATATLYVGRTHDAGSTLEIDSNDEVGVLAGPSATWPSATIHLVVDGALIRDNSGTGLKLTYLPAGSVVSITRTEIRKNGGTANASKYGPTSQQGQRTAGGVLLQSAPPSPFTFERNLVRANGGDQVGVDGTGWNLSGTGAACPSDAASATGNTFLACGATGLSVYSVATGTTPSVTAHYDYWLSTPDVNVTKVDASVYCALPDDVTTLPACPAP